MKDDASPGSADGMTERDGATVDVELRRVEHPYRCVQAELVPAIVVARPCAQTREDLGSEGFVDFPRIKVVELEAVSLQDGRGRMHRPESHLRGIEACPLAVGDGAQDRQAVSGYRFLGCKKKPCRTIGDLRTVARRDIAVLTIEKGLELGQVLRRRIFAYPVVGGIKLPVCGKQRRDLGIEITGFLRSKHAAMA